jgi:hypothetical protein
MKRKLDFITNSSSSSFLVAFLNKIEKMEDVLKIIPEEDKASIVFHDAIKQIPYHLEHGNFDYDFNIVTQVITEDLVKFVLDGYIPSIDIWDLVHVIRDRIKKELFANRVLEPDDWKKLEEELNKQFKEQYGMEPDELRRKKVLELIESFMRQNKGKYIYKFNYGDDEGGVFSELEHDGAFETLPNIRVSHH